MIARQIPYCHGCPYQFEHLDVQILKDSTINGVKWTIGNIDLVIEVGKRIRAIAETKLYRNVASYREVHMPPEQYVQYKKVAKSLKCDFYFIVSDGFQFYITEVDRFARRDTKKVYGEKVIPFSRDEFRILSKVELEEFFIERYG